MPSAVAAAETAATAPGRGPRRSSPPPRRGFAEAESAAGNWQGRADALAQALDAANDAEAAAVLDGMVGVAGALVNHLVIEPGAERAVAAALGDAMGSVIVSGRDEARGAIERLAAGDAGSVAPRARRHRHRGHRPARRSRRPAPGRSPASSARACPGCRRRSPAPSPASSSPTATGAPRWTSPAANPDLTVMTRAGDRFGGGRPWRFGAEQSAGVTRAALDEAITAAERAVETRDIAHGAVDRARAAVHERRDVERRAEEAARHARSAHDRAQAASERLAHERADRVQELEVTGGSRIALVEALAAERGRIAALEARAPELAAAEAEAERRTAAHAAAARRPRRA